MSGDWLEDMWGDDSSTEEELGNLTDALTCAARSLNRPAVLPFPPVMITVVRSIQTLCYIIIFALGITLNAFVIFLVIKFKKLHQRSFIIALQIVVSNVLISAVYLIRPITSIANKWLFGEYMCIITGYMYIAYLLIRTLLMFAFVLDRFLTVFAPYYYPKRSSKMMIAICVATWVFAILARGISLPGVLDCYHFRLSAYLCLHSTGCSSACFIYTFISISFFIGPIPVITIILYALLYRKAQKLRKNEAALAPASVIGATLSREVTRNIRKREWKAMITFFWLFISVFVSTTPAIVIQIVAAILASTIGPSLVLYIVAAITSIMTASLVIVDPIVIMRNADVREVLASIKRKLISS